MLVRVIEYALHPYTPYTQKSWFPKIKFNKWGFFFD